MEIVIIIILMKIKQISLMRSFLSLPVQMDFVKGDFELRHILFYGGCGFTIMRCMSFALENCERKDGNYNILELLKYNFYLPFFYFGPIMTFDRFYIQVSYILTVLYIMNQNKK